MTPSDLLSTPAVGSAMWRNKRRLIYSANTNGHGSLQSLPARPVPGSTDLICLKGNIAAYFNFRRLF